MPTVSSVDVLANFCSLRLLACLVCEFVEVDNLSILIFQPPSCICLCRLLDKDCRVLQVLQKHGVPFEVAVGRNGAFYVNAKDQGIIVAIVNILLNSEMIQDGSEEQMVKFILKSISNRHRPSALLVPI